MKLSFIISIIPFLFFANTPVETNKVNVGVENNIPTLIFKVSWDSQFGETRYGYYRKAFLTGDSKISKYGLEKAQLSLADFEILSVLSSKTSLLEFIVEKDDYLKSTNANGVIRLMDLKAMVPAFYINDKVSILFGGRIAGGVGGFSLENDFDFLHNFLYGGNLELYVGDILGEEKQKILFTLVLDATNEKLYNKDNLAKKKSFGASGEILLFLGMFDHRFKAINYTGVGLEVNYRVISRDSDYINSGLSQTLGFKANLRF